jgi:hypothetical protein
LLSNATCTATPSGLEAASGLTDLDVGSNRLRELPPALGGPQQPLLRVLRAAVGLYKLNYVYP